jgi:hypothetical protein
MCMPVKLPPACVPCVNLIVKPECHIPELRKWPPCEKICMPCCKPVDTPVQCASDSVEEASCRRPEYYIPSYSECCKYPIKPRRLKECCHFKSKCPKDQIGRETTHPFITFRERQDIALGRVCFCKEPAKAKACCPP